MALENYALYPHMTIRDNIAFGLRRLKIGAAEIYRRVGEVVSMPRLQPVISRKPNHLSGGQQQRVAIARAVIKTPDVLRFDEPPSNLDAKLRAQMRCEIARPHKNHKLITVYVTHVQVEAMTLADCIVPLNAGRIEQAETPEEIYERPASLFVAGFIGAPAMNLLPMTAHKAGEEWRREGSDCQLSLSPQRYDLTDGQAVVLGLPPADLVASPAAPNVLEGTAGMIEFHSDQVLVGLPLGDACLNALIPAGERPNEGDEVSFHVAGRRDASV